MVSWRQPEIHDVVLVIAAIDEDLWPIDEQTGKQQDGDLDRVWTAIDQVSIEHVRIVGWRQAVLSDNVTHCT